MQHPTIDRLTAFAGGRVAEDVAAHLQGCSSCRRLVDVCVPATPAAIAAARALDGGLEQLVVPRATYARVRELHRGGMGRAVLARDRRLDRAVVIKELREADDYPDETLRDELRLRLLREAAITSRLQHPSIVPVYEAGTWEDGEPFYAIPYVAGSTLGDAIDAAAGAAARRRLISHVAAVADAVAYAHDTGVVHRDIKPANILIGSRGETVLIDWGLAKLAGEATPAWPRAAAAATGLTQLGVGTAAYMPPEQALGEEPTPMGDVYALGATLYHVLAGVPPYAEVDTIDRRKAVVDDAPVDLAAVAPDVSEDLVAIVNKALARDPADRFPTAGELAEELRRFLAGKLTRTYDYSPWQLARRWAHRHRAIVAAVALAAAVIVAVVAVSVRRIASERDRATAGERAAVLELSRARGAAAARLSTEPAHTLAALVAGIEAVGIARTAGQEPPPEARDGLTRALAAGPAAYQVVSDRSHHYLAALPNGRFATANARGEVLVWELGATEPLKRYDSGVEPLALLSASPSGRFLMTFALPGGAAVIHVDTGAVVPLAPLAAELHVAVWRADDTLITGDVLGAVVSWDVSTGHAKRSIMVGSGATALAEVDDRVIIETHGGDVLAWDGEAGQASPAPGSRADPPSPGPEVRAISLPAGDRWLAAGRDRMTVLWNAATATEERRFGGHRDGALHGLLRPDGIAITAGVGGVYAWDAAPTLPRHGSEVSQLEVDPRTGHALTASLDGAVWSWQDLRRQPITVAPLGVTAARFAGAQRIVVGGLDGRVSIVDRDTGAAVAAWSHEGPVTALAASTDGRVIVSGGADGAVQLWSEGEARMLAGTLGNVASLSLHGSRIVAGGDDGVRAWSADGAALWTLDDGASPTASVAFFTDGDRVLIGGPHASRVLDAATGKVLGAYDGRAVAAHTTAIASTGSLALLGEDGSLRVVRADGSRGPTLTHADSQVTAARWSRDGTLVATGADDGSVGVWRADDGVRLYAAGGDAAVTDLALVDGDRSLFIGDAAGGVRREAITLDAALDRACGVVARFNRRPQIERYCSGSTRTPRTSTLGRMPP